MANGILNGNWRGAEMRAYIASVTRPAPALSAELITALNALYNRLGNDAYQRIVDMGPNDNAAFEAYIIGICSDPCGMSDTPTSYKAARPEGEHLARFGY